MALLLYVITGAFLVLVSHRFVRRIPPASALVVLLIPLCFTGRALLTGRVYGPIDLAYVTEPLNWMRGAQGLPADPHNSSLSDVAFQMIPWRAAVQSALRHGEWPLWNRYLFSGGVLAASAQPAVYSPFTVIACMLPIGIGTTWLASIGFFVAALSAFLFARELDCRESVALIAAAAWPFCTAPAYFILWPLGQSWTLLPFVLLAVRRLIASPSFRSTMLLMIALVLVIFAGHPETVLHVVFVGAAYGIFLIGRDRTNVIRKLLCAFAAGVLALLVTAIYLLPIMEALPQTRDYIDRKELFVHSQTGATGSEALARFAIDLLPSLHERGWRSPAVKVLPLDTAAAGSIILALAIYGLWRVRSAESWFFAGLLAFCLLARTNWRPIAQAWKALPVFDISFNDRLSFAAAFSFVALAAIALEHVCRRVEWRLLAIHVTAVLIALTSATLLIERAGLVDPNVQRWGEYRMFAEIALPALAALLFLCAFPARVEVTALLVLLLAQRVIEGGGVYPVLPAEAAYPPIPILRPLSDAPGPFRIVGHGKAFIPGTSTIYGLEDVRGYTAMAFAPFMETWPLWSRAQPVWFNAVDDLDRPFLSFLNVRYAITWVHERDHAGWREIARQRGSKLLENERVIERAFVPEEIALGNRPAMFEMAIATDFRKRAWVETPGLAEDRANGPGTLKITPANLGLRIDAEMQGPGWIVVSEQAWRGWRAFIDGRRVKTQIANLAFLGIFVPQGKHVVALRYWPESFVLGRTISASTIAVLIVIGIVRQVRSRRRATADWRPRQDSNLRPTA